MSSSGHKEVAQKGHILFEIHRQERELEERLAKAKENSRRVVAEARVEAENIIKSAKEERLKKELQETEERLVMESKAREEEVVDDKEEVENLKLAAKKNHKEAVELVLSRILPGA